MASRRSPDAIALELLNCIEEKGEASKWDLIKVLGNETQFRIWIEEFFLREKVIVERREGAHYYYRKNRAGRDLPQTSEEREPDQALQQRQRQETETLDCCDDKVLLARLRIISQSFSYKVWCEDRFQKSAWVR